LRVTDGIEWVHVRHEEAAAFAAGAEAALTGELAVCAGSCGPGNLHLINGLFDAQRSRVPVLAIAAHIPSDEIGSGYFQETHPQELFRECSVYAEHVATPEQMPRLLRIAMREAIEKRGVAVLVIPGDVGLAEIEAEVETIRGHASRVIPAESQLAAAADALNEGKKVTILAGAGVEGAHDRSEEHTSELQSRENLVCRLLLEKKKRPPTDSSPHPAWPGSPDRTIPLGTEFAPGVSWRYWLATS